MGSAVTGRMRRRCEYRRDPPAVIATTLAKTAAGEMHYHIVVLTERGHGAGDGFTSVAAGHRHLVVGLVFGPPVDGAGVALPRDRHWHDIGGRAAPADVATASETVAIEEEAR